MSRKNICVVTTVPYAINMFMKPHVLKLAEEYDVTVITSGDKFELDIILTENISFISLDIPRKISPLRDLYVLTRLFSIFRSRKFEVVHSLTPKAGLLGMMAAMLAGVPHRVHTFTGQVWANRSGLPRWFLKKVDFITALSSSNLLADSFSQRSFLIDQKVTNGAKISVLSFGSVCGVDVSRFMPDLSSRASVRKSLNIPADSIVFLFLGRVNADKGILDLMAAFSDFADEVPNAHLLVVGPDEQNLDATLTSVSKNFRNRFHRIGFTTMPEKYMAAADAICVPSYREGFGSVIIEAAAVGLPAIASNIYGLVDAVVDGETGILHQAKNISQIRMALMELATNSERRARIGFAARERVLAMFQVPVLTEAMGAYYRDFLLRKEIP